MIKNTSKNSDVVVKLTDFDREILREIIRMEKANIGVFSLPNKQEQDKYQKSLERLDKQFA